MLFSSMPGSSAVSSYALSPSTTSTGGIVGHLISRRNNGSAHSGRRNGRHTPSPKSSNKRSTSRRRLSNGQPIPVGGSVFTCRTGNLLTFSAMILLLCFLKRNLTAEKINRIDLRQTASRADKKTPRETNASGCALTTDATYRGLSAGRSLVGRGD